MLPDTEAIFRALGLPASEVIVYGRSVGSIYAIELARRVPGIRALVLESGIADPLERVLLRVEPGEIGVTAEELSAEARRLLDHRSKLAAFPGPVLVMHTRHDGLVPLSHGERLAEWGGGRLVVFERGDHNTIHWYNGAAIFAELAQLAS